MIRFRDFPDQSRGEAGCRRVFVPARHAGRADGAADEAAHDGMRMGRDLARLVGELYG